VEGTRTWQGRIKPEAREAHETFVAWLQTDEARTQFSKFLLTGYSLHEDADTVTVTLSAAEPPPIIRFLRNSRMWPDFWEFESAGRGTDATTAGTERVRWRRPADGG